jgi:hypothetical protein
LPASGNYSGPTVESGINNPPELSDGKVEPTSGDTKTNFEFSVVYTDIEDDEPTVRLVYISGNAYEMYSDDTTYSDGALFTYSRTLPAGEHTYYFEFSDGENTTRLPESGTKSGPIVEEAPNTPPELSDGKVYPTVGDITTKFTYQVTYTDADDDNHIQCTQTILPMPMGLYLHTLQSCLQVIILIISSSVTV